MKLKDAYLFIVSSYIVGLHIGCTSVKNLITKNRDQVKTDNAFIANDSSNTYRNQYGETIYFKANGTEPFWSLELSKENFRFASVTGGFKTFTASYTIPTHAVDANVKLYRSSTALSEIKIQLIQQPCVDDMSGKQNTHQVTVELKLNADKDFKIFKGCGNYSTDFRLHDIWVLETLHDQSINMQQYGKDRPYIEINSAQNTFRGFTGSHAINGKIFCENNLLRFIDFGIV